MEVNRIMMFSGKIFAISLIALLGISVMAIMSSSAQTVVLEDENEAFDSLKLYSVNGNGVAVDSQDLYRSKIRAVTFIETESNTSSDQLIDFGVKWGTIVIKRASSTTVAEDVAYEVFKMVPESWQGVINSDGKNLEVNGLVTDEAGNEYNVQLNGIATKNTKRGLVLFIKGTLSGDNANYDLYYLLYIHAVKFRSMKGQVERQVLRLPFEKAE